MTLTNLRKFVLLSAVLAAGPAWSQGGPATVVVATAESTTLAPQVQVSGTVISRDDARMAAEAEGLIVSMAEVGDNVATGDVIAKIEDTYLLEQQAENEGLVASQQERIGFLEREVARLRKLAAQNNAARSQLDQTESDLAVARSELRVARARLAQIKIRVYKSSIRAPFPGRITERFVNPGERPGVGTDVLRLMNPNRLEVVARAPLNGVAYLKEGQSIPVQSERYAGTGTIRAIVPFGDTRSHMFEIRLDVPADEWIIGESTKVQVPTAAEKQVLAVPRDAIVLRADGAAVFRINGENKAERVTVEPGVGDGEMIAVVGDIRPGDTVVIRGAERLRPGQDVMISNGAGSGPTGGGTAAGS